MSEQPCIRGFVHSCTPVSFYPIIPVSLYPCICISLYPCILLYRYPCIRLSLQQQVCPFMYHWILYIYIPDPCIPISMKPCFILLLIPISVSPYIRVSVYPCMTVSIKLSKPSCCIMYTYLLIYRCYSSYIWIKIENNLFTYLSLA